VYYAYEAQGDSAWKGVIVGKTKGAYKMELKVFRDTLSAAGGSCTVKAELPIETELLISDYLPQVFKVVKCFAYPVVLQKQLQPGKLTLEGYLRCTVFYQGESGAGLCQADQKLSFTKTLELPPFEFSSWMAAVGGETEYLNCRAVNPRRMEVRGAFSLCVSVHTQLKTDLITAVADGGIEQQSRTITGARSTAVLDKLITADAEVTFHAPPAAVLDISGSAVLRELKILNGKAVAKGEIQAVCLWRADGQGELQHLTATVPFNQIVDAEGLAEDGQCLCVVEPVGFALAQGEQDTQARLTATALLHLRSWRKYELAYVADVFSTRYETRNTLQSVAAEQLACMLDERVSLTASGPLPDEHTHILTCFAGFDAAQVQNRNELPVLAAHGRITALGQNSLGEIESYEKAVELVLPLKIGAEIDCETLTPECWISVEEISVDCAGGSLNAALRVHVEGAVLQCEPFACVQNIELGEELAANDPAISLRIYYAQAGEELFAIAKHFHASPGDMLRANGLEETEETLPSARRLLIPGA
jgi:hypothetical protein